MSIRYPPPELPKVSIPNRSMLLAMEKQLPKRSHLMSEVAVCMDLCPGDKYCIEKEKEKEKENTYCAARGVCALHCSRAVTMATIGLRPAINSLIARKLYVKLEKINK